MYAVPLPWLLAAGAAVGIGVAVYNNWDAIVDTRTWEEQWIKLESKLNPGTHATDNDSTLFDAHDAELDSIANSGSDTETEDSHNKSRSTDEKSRAESSTVAKSSEAGLRHRNAFDMPSSADSKVNIEILDSGSEIDPVSDFSLVSDVDWSELDDSVGDADTE